MPSTEKNIQALRDTSSFFEKLLLLSPVSCTDYFIDLVADKDGELDQMALVQEVVGGLSEKATHVLINAAAKRVFDENKQYSKTNNVYVWLIAARDAFAQDRQRGRTRGPKPPHCQPS